MTENPYGNLDPLQLDLATIVARLEQVKDEGGFEQANPVVVDRIITCDLPRLRGHLSPLAMMLLRAGFPDGRFEQEPEQTADVRVRLGDDVVMQTSTDAIGTLILGLGGTAGEWVELLNADGHVIEARVRPAAIVVQDEAQELLGSAEPAPWWHVHRSPAPAPAPPPDDEHCPGCSMTNCPGV